MAEKSKKLLMRFYVFFNRHAFSFILFGALFCTLAVKFFRAVDDQMLHYYHAWIQLDIVVLLLTEVICYAIYHRFKNKWTYRIITFFAALVCTWSVINAAWVIRIGKQVWPENLLMLVWYPIDALFMVGINLIKMPLAACALLIPSAIALSFFFYVLAKPIVKKSTNKRFATRTSIILLIVLLAIVIRIFSALNVKDAPPEAIGMEYNSQLRAVSSILSKHNSSSGRIIPVYEKEKIKIPQNQNNPNVIIIVLEGVQYFQTSLFNPNNNQTPFLRSFAQENIELANTRTSLAHTSKAIFALLTGMYPSASQDVAEAVYVETPYRSLPMILKNQMNYRTAFFQSPDGCFESRPSLIHNMGFENFYARQDFADPNQNIGYISYDEFAFLEPIKNWIKKDTSPFLLTYMCSVTHDPYTVPPRYGQPEDELIDKYKQTIKYTDKFLETFIKTLKANGLYENSIICIISDHAEGFGEHGVFAHERIGFEEAVRIPCIIKPANNRTPKKVTLPTSSIDITPTILAMMNVDVNNIDFDGVNVMNPQNLDRKVFYSGWMQDGPAGYLQKNMKYLYDPESQALSIFNIDSDPFEKYPVVFSVDDNKQHEISQEIIEWKQSTIFDIQQEKAGQVLLYDKWRCKWNNRIPRASHLDEDSFFDRRAKKKLAEKQNNVNQTTQPQ